MINIDVRLNLYDLIKVIEASEPDVLNILNISSNDEVVELLIKNMGCDGYRGLEALRKVYKNSDKKSHNWWKDFKTTLRDLTFNEIAMFVCNTIGTSEEYFTVINDNGKTEFEKFLKTIDYDFNNRPFSEYYTAFEDFPIIPKLIKLVIDKSSPEMLLDKNLLKETYFNFDEYLDLFKDYDFPQNDDIDLKRFQTFISGLKNTSGEKTLHKITNLFNKLESAEFQQVMIDAGLLDMKTIEKTLDELIKEKEEITSKINQLLKIKNKSCLTLNNTKEKIHED